MCVCVCVCVCVRVRALVHVRRSCKHKYQALSHLRARICACTCMFVHKSLTFIDQGLPPLLLCKLVLSRSSREDFHLSLHTILPVIFSSMYSGPCACVRVCICACVRVCVCVCVCVCVRGRVRACPLSHTARLLLCFCLLPPFHTTVWASWSTS